MKEGRVSSRCWSAAASGGVVGFEVGSSFYRSVVGDELVGVAPVARFASGPSGGQGTRGACRSKRLFGGEHVPDRFGEAAGDFDVGDFAAACAAVTGAHPLDDRLVARVAAGDVGGFDERPPWMGPASQGRRATDGVGEDASRVALPY